MAEKSKDEQMKDFINGVGAIAEMTLIFYRNVLAAGATPDEAFKVTGAFVAGLFGKSGRKNTGTD